VGYQKLAPNQEDQIRRFRKQGKSPRECSDYMKETYGIDVPEWKISYITGKKPVGLKSRVPKPIPRRKYGFGRERVIIDTTNNAREVVKAVEEKLGIAVPIEQAVKDITEGMQQIFEGYTKIFLNLRLQVIKEKGKVFNMLKAADIKD